VALSFTEELASQYYKHLMKNEWPKYIVSEKVKYRGPRGGWKDIDILALGQNEICIIETKHYPWRGTKRETIKHILDSFKTAEKFVKKQPYAKGKKVKKIFIVEYASQPMLKELKKQRIDVRELDKIVEEFIQILYKRIWKKEWKGRGKEENNVTRTLLVLLEHEFIKEKKLDISEYWT